MSKLQYQSKDSSLIGCLKLYWFCAPSYLYQTFFFWILVFSWVATYFVGKNNKHVMFSISLMIFMFVMMSSYFYFYYPHFFLFFSLNTKIFLLCLGMDSLQLIRGFQLQLFVFPEVSNCLFFSLVFYAFFIPIFSNFSFIVIILWSIFLSKHDLLAFP